MVRLPPPFTSRPYERCPNCLDRVPDAKAFACDRCGYQLRMPRVAVAGLLLMLAAIGSFFVSVFGGYLFPWPAMPIPIPFLETPTPADLERLFLWLGALLLAAGIAAAYLGAYAVRRKAERAVAREGRLA